MLSFKKNYNFKNIEMNGTLLNNILEILNMNKFILIVDADTLDTTLQKYNFIKEKKFNLIKVSENNINIIKELCYFKYDLYLIYLKNQNAKIDLDILKEDYYISIDYWFSENNIYLSIDKEIFNKNTLNNIKDLINKQN